MHGFGEVLTSARVSGLGAGASRTGVNVRVSRASRYRDRTCLTMAVSPLYARLDWAKATGWGRFLAAYLVAVRGR